MHSLIIGIGGEMNIHLKTENLGKQAEILSISSLGNGNVLAQMR